MGEAEREWWEESHLPDQASINKLDSENMNKRLKGKNVIPCAKMKLQ